jgi:hypothetical protein
MPAQARFILNVPVPASVTGPGCIRVGGTVSGKAGRGGTTVGGGIVVDGTVVVGPVSAGGAVLDGADGTVDAGTVEAGTVEAGTVESGVVVVDDEARDDGLAAADVARFGPGALPIRGATRAVTTAVAPIKASTPNASPATSHRCSTTRPRRCLDPDVGIDGGGSGVPGATTAVSRRVPLVDVTLVVTMRSSVWFGKG